MFGPSLRLRGRRLGSLSLICAVGGASWLAPSAAASATVEASPGSVHAVSVGPNAAIAPKITSKDYKDLDHSPPGGMGGPGEPGTFTVTGRGGKVAKVCYKVIYDQTSWPHANGSFKCVRGTSTDFVFTPEFAGVHHTMAYEEIRDGSVSPVQRYDFLVARPTGSL